MNILKTSQKNGLKIDDFKTHQSHTTRVIKSYRAIYFEDDTGKSLGPREIVFKEHLVFILVPIASASISNPVVDQHPIATIDDELIEDVNPIAPNVDLVL